MNNETLYERLGLTRDASPEEIRRAYRQLVLHLHPDTNANAGETELFLGIQQAFETLSDSDKKAEYDHQLPHEPTTPLPLHIKLNYSQPSLIRLSEPQLIYTLLELTIHPDSTEAISSTPLNLSLVLDCSTSMQGDRLDTVKTTAVDLLRQLQPKDIISLVKFSDRADLLIPASNIADLISAEMKIQLLQAGGGTEIYKGLESGFNQVRQFRTNNRINHIILITDGRTYGDEESCEQLADQATALGIGISALGIGSQWNDSFLDHLTSKTGGFCKYISKVGEIRSFLLEKIARLGSSFAEHVTYNFETPKGIELTTAFRLQPDSSPLETTSPLVLGYVPQHGIQSLLLEFTIKDIPENLDFITLMKGHLNYEVPSNSYKTSYTQRLILDRPVSAEPSEEVPPHSILQAMLMLSLYQMQERAREEMGRGDISAATRRLQNLATHLLDQGERDLARSVLSEVAYIQNNQSFSEDGEKRIKYSTRSLLLPAKIKESRL
jgi:Ca-activated chloride channel homolog